MKKFFATLSIIGMLSGMTACAAPNEDENTMRSPANRLNAQMHAEGVVMDYVRENYPELDYPDTSVYVTSVTYLGPDETNGPRLSAYVMLNTGIIYEDIWPDCEPAASEYLFRRVHLTIPVTDEHPDVLVWYENNLY